MRHCHIYICKYIVSVVFVCQIPTFYQCQLGLCRSADYPRMTTLLSAGSSCGCAPSTGLRIVQFNQLHATSHRLEEICDAFSRQDIFMLTSTKRGAINEKYAVIETKKLALVDSGWAATRQSHARVMIAVSQRLPSKAKIAQVYAPPFALKNLVGRSGAIRMNKIAWILPW